MTALCGVLAAAGKAEAAEAALESAGSEADVVLYNSVVHGWCIRRDPEKARLILDKMRKSGLTPTEGASIEVAECFARAGQGQNSLDAVKAMERDGFIAGVSVFNVVVKGLCDANYADKAEKVIQMMFADSLNLERIDRVSRKVHL